MYLMVMARFPHIEAIVLAYSWGKHFYIYCVQLSQLSVVHYIDNEGVISNQFHLHDRRVHISGDLWDEKIAHFDTLCLQHFNQHDVRWLQAHPEARYESPTEYSLEESLHFLADDLAKLARQNTAAPDPFLSGWQTHPRDVFVRYRNRRIFDAIAQAAHRTTVWEMEQVSHRVSANHPVYLQYTLFIVLCYVTTEDLPRHTEDLVVDDISQPVFSKHINSDDFVPTDDSECFWSFSSAHCAYPEICEYRYAVGDLTPSQS